MTSNAEPSVKGASLLLVAASLCGCLPDDRVTEVLTCTAQACRVIVNNDYRATVVAPVLVGDCLTGIRGDSLRKVVDCWDLENRQ
jgi:hypothetical protein